MPFENFMMLKNISTLVEEVSPQKKTQN